MKSLNDHFFSLKELLDLFAHVPCCFSGEGERENLRGVDAFFFDHVCDPGCDGRDLACACEDQLGGLGVFDDIIWLDFMDGESHRFLKVFLNTSKLF